VEIYNVHALHAQFCTQVGISIVLIAEQFPHPCIDCSQLFLTGHIGFVFAKVRVFAHLVVQRTAAYHEKFVQIALENGEKRQPFTQGIGFVPGFFQYPLIKFQPGKFSIVITVCVHYNPSDCSYSVMY
jgi:hypothetical protein